MQKIPVQIIEPSSFVDSKIHVRLTEGFFQQCRRLISWPLLIIYFALVWLQVDGQPWLLFDFSQRRILLFGTSLSWHDLPLLAGIMIAGTSLLFFMAVGWGRIWCGFACPQSIWTWVFIRIEQWTEGRANIRARHEHQPLRGGLFIRRLSKHLLWISFSIVTAVTFTGYFIPVRELVTDLFTWQAGTVTLGWLTCMAALTYLNAGLVREKICLHACPYARFQSVMFDDQTRTVSYDKRRGEPRSNKRMADGSSGDCVDCGLCVQVCPTGIDIRDGLQAACIDCGACIDACDAVMDKIHRPKGLIKFCSEDQLAKRSSPVWRPRLIGYSLVFLSTSAAVVYGFSNKTELLVEIRRDRGQLFHQRDEKTICNRYLFKLESFNPELQRLHVTISGLKGAELEGGEYISADNFGQWLPYRICAPTSLIENKTLRIHFRSENFEHYKSTTFLTKKR
ncbi:cytochrome c oxidase accessory protein CcoG [Neptunomonas qingdaonensis]|uniref:Cytochrome c oxidase accessory protein FixG n=1 Tax=Neptunomonas qingdaonensis TaxID=1045558 RepID=A0A1I2QCN9_9GAMM|nr:cytochrome c oxidase accessory protein CcoG [Neptunomonas qingdaonensis]SFG25139.1 cytochrome c oxidase accessory protein FixG [Neptunomonas qingdaonensis]